MYILYAQNLKGVWEKIIQASILKEIKEETQYITPKEYYCYMIKETTKDGDRIILRKRLYEEIGVEFTDNIKNKYEVKAISFKPSRMKKKEELKRLTKDYI